MLFRPDRRRYFHQLRDGTIQFARHDFLDDARRKRRKPQNPAEIDRTQTERVRKRLLVGVGAVGGLADYESSLVWTEVCGSGVLTSDWAVFCEDGYNWFDFHPPLTT